MSVSYHAYVVYGVEVRKDWLYVINKRRVCKHKEVPAAKFCPECGKPMYVEDRELTIEHAQSDEVSWFAPNYEDEDVYVGFMLGEVDDYNNNVCGLSTPSEEQKQKLREYLKQMDIETDVDDFGTYLILECSY